MNTPSTPTRVLVLDDDRAVGDSLKRFVETEGLVCDAIERAGEVFDRLATGRYGVLICDVMLEDANGMDVLRRVAREHPAVAVIMITGYGAIEAAVEAIRIGAVDYLAKPIVESELRMAIRRAARHHELCAENTRLRDAVEGQSGSGAIIGEDHRMHRAMEVVHAVAGSSATVLLTGETGTGKSMIAKELHRLSSRSGREYVELHCGSLPESLLESELFGHVKGAFTGAHADKRGRFELADGGTIFLDEINTAPKSMQVRLLRVLQERAFEPVGSTETKRVDVRVVVASNEPLDQLVRNGEFREDLYHRMNVVHIELPPLREREEDIPRLAAHFLAKYRLEHASVAERFSEEAMRLLVSYAFPGNVRELANIVERVSVLSREEMVPVDLLPKRVLSAALEPAGSTSQWKGEALSEALKAPEREILLRALEANRWNRQETADQLSINRTTLYKKMKQHGLDRLAG